jgi:hypothetical protein
VLKGDFTIHAGWGHHIEWFHPEEFNVPFLDGRQFSVYGLLPGKLPKKGDTLLGEFQRSWILFRFDEVKREFDPPDMFFGKVSVVAKEMKG